MVLWASTAQAHVMILANVDAYKLAAKTFRGTAGERRPGAHIRGLCGRWRRADFRPTSGCPRRPRTWPAASSIVEGPSRAPHGVFADLGHQSAVDDIYSDAASGQRHFTLNILVGSKVLVVQPAAYGLVEWKLSCTGRSRWGSTYSRDRGVTR